MVRHHTLLLNHDFISKIRFSFNFLMCFLKLGARSCLSFRLKSDRRYFCVFPHIYFYLHFLSEFLDDCCYPAGGGLLCQCSDTRRGDGTDEGNAAFHTETYFFDTEQWHQDNLSHKTWSSNCSSIHRSVKSWNDSWLHNIAAMKALLYFVCLHNNIILDSKPAFGNQKRCDV